MSDGYERTSDERERTRTSASALRTSASAPPMSASRPGSSASAGANGDPPTPPTHPPAHPTHPPTHAGAAGAAGPHHLAVAVRHHPAGTPGSAASSPLLVLVLAAAVVWFLVELFQPIHGSPHGQVTVTIPAHSTASQIGDELANAGVVSSGFFFELRATLDGKRGELLSGTYHLQQGMTYSSVLKVLSTPPTAAKVTNITIIEGRTRAQINDLLRSQGVARQLLRRHPPLAADQLRGLRRAPAARRTWRASCSPTPISWWSRSASRSW